MTPLAQAINQEAALVRKLSELLLREWGILESGTPESLEEITAEKSDLMEQIALASKERESIQPWATGTDIPAWFACHPKEKMAATYWAELLDATKVAHEQHQKNGFLINALLRKTNDALSILIQHQKEHSLYDKDGQSAGNTGRRIVESA